VYIPKFLSLQIKNFRKSLNFSNP